MPAKKTEQKSSNIIEAMIAITRDIGAIEKDQQAPSAMGGFRFRGIDQVLAALSPQLADKAVALQVEVLEVGAEVVQQKNGSSFLTTAKVRYTFHHVDGTSLAHTVVGQGMDRADKGVAKALSTAFKSMAFQVFCIPTDEAVDTENDSHEEPAASHAARRAQERGDPPPSPTNKPSGKGITEKMAGRLAVAGRERSEKEGTTQRDELNRGLEQAGYALVPQQAGNWGEVVAHLMDAVPSRRNAPDAYDAVYEAITNGPPIGGEPPEDAAAAGQGGDDDIPF